jgi:hypothetical protein
MEFITGRHTTDNILETVEKLKFRLFLEAEFFYVMNPEIINPGK